MNERCLRCDGTGKEPSWDAKTPECCWRDCTKRATHEIGPVGKEYYVFCGEHSEPSLHPHDLRGAIPTLADHAPCPPPRNARSPLGLTEHRSGEVSMGGGSACFGTSALIYGSAATSTASGARRGRAPKPSST